MDIFNILKNLDIDYKLYQHKAVFTINDAIPELIYANGIVVKNLLLKNSHGTYYLVLNDGEKADLKTIASNFKTGHLSFATNDELKWKLNLLPGSVSPFGLINNQEHDVIVLISKSLIDKSLVFHPNTNTKSLLISYSDLEKFLNYTQNKFYFYS
jgi:Ala-tRNA(Pro) deacylase